MKFGMMPLWGAIVSLNFYTLNFKPQPTVKHLGSDHKGRTHMERNEENN